MSPLERRYIQLLGAPILGLRVRARAILPFLYEIGDPKRIIDAGSGRGIMTMACARMYPRAQVVGLDLNNHQNVVNAEIARTLGLSNVQFICHDVLRLRELGRFDAILSSDNLEHLEDDLECVRVFYEALRPGGYLVVHVPHLTRNLFGWHRTNWMGIEGHVRPGYTRESLQSLLLQVQFEVLRLEYNYNSIETLANDLSYAITGGRERNKELYAICFPFLLALATLGSLYRPKRDGTGLVALARKRLV